MLGGYDACVLSEHALVPRFQGVALVVSQGRAVLGAPFSSDPLSSGNVNVIQPDYAMAARDFLRTFRSGLLGQVMLDRDIIPAC